MTCAKCHSDARVSMLCGDALRSESSQYDYEQYQCRNFKTNTTEVRTAEIHTLALSVTIRTKPRTEA